MAIVTARLLCAAVLLLVITAVYAALRFFGKKGIPVLDNGIICWILAFIAGIFLFVSVANFLLT